MKKYSGNRKETPPVDIDTFFEYFKNLNFCEEEDSDINIDELCNDPMYNEIISRNWGYFPHKYSSYLN